MCVMYQCIHCILHASVHLKQYPKIYSFIDIMHVMHIWCEKVLFAYSLPVRYLESLLRQASNSLILHCPTMHCFVNQNTESEPIFRAEEFSDISGQPHLFITLCSSSLCISISSNK